MSKQDFDKTIRIPVITDVIRPGDPEIVARARNQNVRQQKHEVFEQRLKERIAELQSITGQDECVGLARAHAIRAEGSDTNTAQTFPAFETHIDRARDELIRELSSLLK